MSARIRRLALIFTLWTLLAACRQSNASPVGTDLLFHDDFEPGQIGAWQIEGDETARAAIEGGELKIAVDAPQTIHYATLSEPAFEDFVLEVDVTRLEGDLESSAGVLFRISDENQFYRFEITGESLYMVERHDSDGTWARLIEGWTESPAINGGLGATNKLTIKADGANLSFYVNEQLILQTADDNYGLGKIALDAGTFGRPGLRIAFDNLKVSKP